MVAPLEVTQVILHPASDPVLTFADIVLNEAIAIHGLRLVKTPDKVVLAMPQRSYSTPCRECGHRNPVNNQFCGRCGCKVTAPKVTRHVLDVVHPISSPARKIIENAVHKAYEESLNKQRG